jgi:hypothetical protein
MLDWYCNLFDWRLAMKLTFQKRLIIVLIIIISILFLLSLFLGVKLYINSESDLEENNQSFSKSEEDNGSGFLFEGEYVFAKLPDNWEIIEYLDSESVPNSAGFSIECPHNNDDCDGLSGLEILNEDGNWIFNFSVWAGGGAYCPPLNYSIFPDSQEGELELCRQKYWDNINSSPEVCFDVGFEVYDYSNEEYSEYDLLGTTVRRIDQNFFTDNDRDKSEFGGNCDRVSRYATIYLEKDTFSYIHGSEVKRNDYVINVSEDSSIEDLGILDEILKSMGLF